MTTRLKVFWSAWGVGCAVVFYHIGQWALAICVLGATAAVWMPEERNKS